VRAKGRAAGMVKRKILCILPPILRISSGVLHFFLQPLLGGIKDKLVDTLHDLSQTGH